MGGDDEQEECGGLTPVSNSADWGGGGGVGRTKGVPNTKGKAP